MWVSIATRTQLVSWQFDLSFSLPTFRIQRLRAINHTAVPRRAAKLRPERRETSLMRLLRSLLR